MMFFREKYCFLQNCGGVGEGLTCGFIAFPGNPNYDKQPVLFQADFIEENTVYEVRYDFALGEDITIPNNCVLEFKGGSISGTYTLTLADTCIISKKSCFGSDITISGRSLEPASPEWFVGTDADKIEKAISIFGVVQLSNRDYHISRSIVVNNSCDLRGFGGADINAGRAVQYFQRVYVENGITDAFVINGQYVTPSDLTYHIGSFFIRNISFVGGNRTVDCLTFTSGGGPSGPVVVEQCGFVGFNKAINFDNTATNLVTGCGCIRLVSNKITNCNYGVYAKGLSTLVGIYIADSEIEQNITAGIYIKNDSGTSFANGKTGITIARNLLEGQPTAIVIAANGAPIVLEHNQYEWQVQHQLVQIDANNASPVYISDCAPTGIVDYQISEASLTINMIRSSQLFGSTRFKLTNCLLMSTTLPFESVNGYLFSQKSVPTTGEDTYLYKGENTMDSYINGEYYKKLLSTALNFNTPNLTAGDYILSVRLYIKGWDKRQSENWLYYYLIGTNATGNIGTYCIPEENVLILNIRVTLESALSNVRLQLAAKDSNVEVYASNVAVYNVGNCVCLPPKERIFTTLPTLVNTPYAEALYNNSGTFKSVWWNGTAWVDATGNAV